MFANPCGGPAVLKTVAKNVSYRAQRSPSFIHLTLQ